MPGTVYRSNPSRGRIPRDGRGAQRWSFTFLDLSDIPLEYLLGLSSWIPGHVMCNLLPARHDRHQETAYSTARQRVGCSN